MNDTFDALHRRKLANTPCLLKPRCIAFKLATIESMWWNAIRKLGFISWNGLSSSNSEHVCNGGGKVLSEVFLNCFGIRAESSIRAFKLIAAL